ncbi:MAG: oxidoreductase [Candidatus Methanomethylophilaceae archaeon]|jgi:F420-non-reducing hydrogenase small subunit|nr:oxidoreductase [Candidatus Thermoplasmatota archaeon]
MGFIEKVKGIFKRSDKAEAAPAPAKEAPAKEAVAKAAEFPADSPIDGYVPGLGAPPGGKINLAIYWAAACGGCDVSLLDTDEKILNVSDMSNIVMWPIAVDGKEKDIEAMEDGEITVAIINGAIRNSENEHMAKLLRKKSQILVSYGACACLGGSPALANLVPGGHKEIKDHVYSKVPSSANFLADSGKKIEDVMPRPVYEAPEGTLTLPVLYDTVKTLDQTVDVDYYIPGCPPTQKSIAQLLNALVGFVYKGEALPPKGTVIGVLAKSLCEECHRHKENRRITNVYEPHEVMNVDHDLCLLDQGILCLGAGTIAGCGAPCTKADQPCRGCYGPTQPVSEQGASIFTAIASLFPVQANDATMDEDDMDEIMSVINDPLGYFYAFSMSKSLIKRAVKEGGQ